MKIGYRTSGLRWSFAEKLQLAKELGLEAVEVSGGEFKKRDEAAKAKEMAQEVGITISALGDDVNLCVPSLLDET